MEIAVHNWIGEGVEGGEEEDRHVAFRFGASCGSIVTWKLFLFVFSFSFFSPLVYGFSRESFTPRQLLRESITVTSLKVGRFYFGNVTRLLPPPPCQLRLEPMDYPSTYCSL